MWQKAGIDATAVAPCARAADASTRVGGDNEHKSRRAVLLRRGAATEITLSAAEAMTLAEH